jgi:hypothetical protein
MNGSLQVTKSIVSLLRHFKWNKFCIVREKSPRWETVAQSLVNWAKNHSMTINDNLEFEDTNLCCVNKDPCCQRSYMYEIVQQTHTKTRSNFSLHHCPLVLEHFDEHRSIDRQKLYSKSFGSHSIRSGVAA